MAAAQNQQVKRPIPAIEPFRTTEGETTDFRDWLVKFQVYLKMIQGPIIPQQPGQPPAQQGLTEATKMHYLVMNLGSYALRSFSKHPIYTRMEEDDPQLTYQEFLDAAKRHFSPPTTMMKARYDFVRRQQEPGESIDEYMTALRTMALDCQFGDDNRINEELLCRLVQGISDTRTQQELLATEGLTLDRAVAITKANETAKSASTAMRQTTAPSVQQISRGRGQVRGQFRGRGRGAPMMTNRHSQPTTQVQTRTTSGCMGCGATTHQFGDARCSARNSECRWCKKKGHLERVCMAKKKAQRGRGAATANTSQPVRVMDATIQQVHKEDAPSDEPFSATFFLANGDSEWIPLEMEVDTGARPSVIPQQWYQTNLARIPIKKVGSILRNYDGTVITGIRGLITTKVLFGGRTQKIKFYVRDGSGTPIAGRNLLCALQVHIQAKSGGRGEVGVIHKDDIVKEFPKLLAENLGTFPGQKHYIRLKPDAIPKAAALRTIPLTRQEAVKEEIREMDKAGIWEEISASEWVHPLVTVPKPDGGVRITTDLTALNNYIIPERYPLPRIKDLFLKFTGAKMFSKLDLKKGYYHIPLAPDSKPLTTTITPLGLRQYNRLPMGLTDAASAFQRRIHQALAGLPGVVVYIDDILVFGETEEEHDRRLRAVFSRLVEYDFRLQPKKCVVGAAEIPAFGHIVSTHGIRPDPKNLKPIFDAVAPTNVKETQSFLGLINYYNDFLPNLADDVEPLRKLTRKEEPFAWTSECQQRFEQLKQKVAKVTQLALFDPGAPTTVTTDASDYGLGAVLTQRQGDKEVPIAFFNKTLDGTERNYAAGEKEALAVLKACEHWEDLLLGRKFKIRTDHQALTTLLKSPKNLRQSSKFQRWQTRLAEFDYNIEHIPGETNRIADYLSRMKVTPEEQQVLGIRLRTLQEAVAADETLQKVKEYVQTYWPKTAAGDRIVSRFHKVRTQLQWRDGLLWKDDRIVVPSSQQRAILTEFHRGHPGIERMKRLLRVSYWWPLADDMIRDVVQQCHGCQMSQKTQTTKRVPTTTIPSPKEAGRQYAIDITGPFNGRYLTVLIDYYSRFPEVLDSSITTSRTIVKWLTEIFDRAGNPDAIVSDNGPQFTSEEFEKFLRERDIHHYRTAVYNPQENGLVESFNRYLKYGIQAFQASGTAWTKGINELVTSYRFIPLEGGESPAQIFYGHPTRYAALPNMKTPRRRTVEQQQLQQPTTTTTATTPEYIHTGRSLFTKGQKVLTKLPHVWKGYPPYSNPKTVERVLGYWTYLLSDGQVWNARKMKAYSTWKPHHEDEVISDTIPRQRRRGAALLHDGLTTYFQPRNQVRRGQRP